jgi:hypothetical protein
VNNFPRQEIRWITSDGRVHDSERAAIVHENRVDQVAEFNRLFDAGSSFTTAMDATGQIVFDADREVLSLLTRDSLLLIPHWQCRDAQPGYKLVRQTIDEGFFVHGYAGSWSGAFGQCVSYVDLVAYVRQTIAKFKFLPKKWPMEAPYEGREHL